MALKGTLKDFAVADILQLIGQQQKTGTLHLKANDQHVDVLFKDGVIVRADSDARRKKELIGEMLVRSQHITQAQLDEALEVQQRTLQRLGDVLVGMNAIDRDRFRKMVYLQTTETVYQLFTWKSGGYEFEQGDVVLEPELSPLRAELVLMEGFRRVDEWPLIRKTISGYGMVFERLKPLPAASPSDLSEPDDPFEEGGKSELKAVGGVERAVYQYITPERTVRNIIDLAVLGEFETCKALSNLVEQGYLKPVPGTGRTDPIVGEATGARRLLARSVGFVSAAAVIAAIAFAATRADLLGGQRLTGAPASRYAHPAVQQFLSRQQLSRIVAALGVYRLENGEVPDQLNKLVEVGLLASSDLHYPWRDGYYYRKADQVGFVLLPPLR